MGVPHHHLCSRACLARARAAGWYTHEHEVVAANHEVTISFAVNEQGMDEVKAIATAVSDPDSPKYGQFLTQAQLDEIVAPKAEDVEAVTSWLTENSVTYQLSLIHI